MTSSGKLLGKRRRHLAPRVNSRDLQLFSLPINVWQEEDPIFSFLFNQEWLIFLSEHLKDSRVFANMFCAAFVSACSCNNFSCLTSYSSIANTLRQGFKLKSSLGDEHNKHALVSIFHLMAFFLMKQFVEREIQIENVHWRLIV